MHCRTNGNKTVVNINYSNDGLQTRGRSYPAERGELRLAQERQ
jgi:hypothetical protein